MRDGMPHGTSLFGSAARVYSKDLDWVTDPKSSPLPSPTAPLTPGTSPNRSSMTS
ncbi:hypothetical protein [Arthrobacter sp. H14-L1]|uniref:hypothetical protein n=1 Tax=Arthrobacter sp. H14-L1 TaxID=2996697 RepID=UPI00226F53DE|nr:hypothetical protein [Arthrobacter sp. H14-L1]